MDAPRTSFVLTIAALLAGTALAEPPSQSAPVRYSGNVAGPNNWSSTAPTTAPTITASPSSRYAYPQAPASTTGYPAQSNNPFATSQPAAPAASATKSGNLAPPPWPTSTSTLAPPPSSNWNSTTPVTPVDRSVLANPASPQPSSGWTSIGSTIAAPPLLLPQLPTTVRSSFTPSNTTPIDSGPSFTTDSYRGSQPTSNTSSSWAQPSTSSSPPTDRSTSAPDNWATAWDGSTTNNNNSSGPSIGRTNATREPEFPSSPRLGSNSPDVRSTVAKPTDSWSDDSWSRNSPPSSTGVGASIGASRTAGIGSANNTAPAIQSPTNAPLSPPIIGSAGSNTNFNGMNPNASQPPTIVNASKPTQPTTANGEPQPWVTLLAAILGLAGSIAGNIYLGWSYMDARQKYQALVRRTADTFRRTKVAA